MSFGDCCMVVGAIFSTNRRILVQDYLFIANEVVLANTPRLHRTREGAP